MQISAGAIFYGRLNETILCATLRAQQFCGLFPVTEPHHPQLFSQPPAK